jgi:O-antigen ligase
MPSNTIYDKRYIFSEKWPSGVVTISIVGACLLGWMIASEKWLLVAGSFGLLLLLVRPIEVALGLYTFLIPFESMTTMENSTGPTVTLLRYVGLLAIFTILGVGWLSERLSRPPKTALFWSLFVLWGTASTLWAIDPELALRRIPTAVGMWLLYMAVASVRISTRELSWVTFLTILGGCGASLYSTYMFIRTGETIGRVSLAEGSTQSDPNFFALALLLPLSLALGEVLASRSLSGRLLYLVTTGMISVAVFLTMSRGALAAVGAITIVFLLRFRLNWRLLIPVAIAGSALLFMPRLFFERMQEASTSRLAGRQDIWQVGIHSLQSYGVFGAGMDNFSRAFQKFAGTSRFFAGDQRDSHNIYLATTVEYGIVGMLFLIAAVRSHLKAFHLSDRNSLASARLVAFEAACWGMLIAGFTLDVLWRKAFWLAWALSLAAMQVLRENKQPLNT